MPYSKNSDLPDSVAENLPEDAKDIYREVFNSALEEYESSEKRKGDNSREETAHAVAWSAVKTSYTKENGTWKNKGGD